MSHAVQTNLLVTALEITSFASITCKQHHCARLRPRPQSVLEAPRDKHQNPRTTSLLLMLVLILGSLEMVDLLLVLLMRVLVLGRMVLIADWYH